MPFLQLVATEIVLLTPNLDRRRNMRCLKQYKPSTGVIENFDSGHPAASVQSLEPNSANTENMAPDNSSSPWQNVDSVSV